MATIVITSFFYANVWFFLCMFGWIGIDLVYCILYKSSNIMSCHVVDIIILGAKWWNLWCKTCYPCIIIPASHHNLEIFFNFWLELVSNKPQLETAANKSLYIWNVVYGNGRKSKKWPGCTSAFSGQKILYIYYLSLVFQGCHFYWSVQSANIILFVFIQLL